MQGHSVYIALLVFFIAVSAALALIAARVAGRLTRMDDHDLNTCTIVNPILTAVFVLMMLTTSDFFTAPFFHLLSGLAVGFLLPLVFLSAWSIWKLCEKLIVLIDRNVGANSGD